MERVNMKTVIYSLIVAIGIATIIGMIVKSYLAHKHWEKVLNGIAEKEQRRLHETQREPFIGHKSLNQITTGSSNVFIGNKEITKRHDTLLGNKALKKK